MQSVEGHGAVCGRTQCSLWKDTMQSVEGHNAVSWPFKALVCPPLHMMSNTLCNHSETTDYTAMKTASRAATLETKQNLTPQPCCQLMCVNNYSKKRVTDPFDFRPPRTPVGSKPEWCIRGRAAQGYSTAFSQQMTPLGRSRLPFHHSSVPPVQSASERAVRQKGQAPQSLI